MTIKTFVNRLTQATEQLVPAMLDIGKTVMLNRKADIQQRIQESGLDADGKPLPPYTREYQQFKTDVGRYRGHVDLTLGNYSVNKRITAVNKRARRRKQIAAAFGQGSVGPLTGLPLAEAKAQRRGKKIPKGSQLWQSIHLTHEEATGTRIEVKIGATDDINKKKAEGIAIRRGNFLRMSQDEVQHSLTDIDEGFVDYIQNKIGK